MTKKRKGWKTLAEHDAELKAEGKYDEFIERTRKQEEERQKLWAKDRQAEKAILEDLRAIGYREVQSVWDFVNTDDPYPDAVPILLHHLPKPYPDRLRAGIARALAVPEARYAWAQILEAYRKEPPMEVGEMAAKEGLAVALSAIADDDVIDDVLEVFEDKSECNSRMILTVPLEKSKDPRATEALLALRDDPLITDPEDKKELEKIIKRHMRNKRAK